VINRLQCIIHGLISEPRHGALMSKCSAIRLLNSDANILDGQSSIVKDRVLKHSWKSLEDLETAGLSAKAREVHVGVLCTTSA